MTTHTLNFYADPGHGWLEIPRRMLNQLGIAKEITTCSYVRGDSVYLEEDCDLSTFMRAAEKLGWTIVFKEIHSNYDSFIRNLRMYRP